MKITVDFDIDVNTKSVYSIEVDRYNPTALTHCLKKMEDNISDFEYEWRIVINAGGIDYGVYLNIHTFRKEIVISNQPEGDGEDSLEDLFECLRALKEDEE